VDSLQAQLFYHAVARKKKEERKNKKLRTRCAAGVRDVM
jgi:hypothetical protein